MGKAIRRLRRPRVSAPPSLSASTHPTRQAILKALKDGTKTTVDLEEVTGETRYNLYHHLAVLEDADLVRHRRKGKIKEYRLAIKRKPPTKYYHADVNDMFVDRKQLGAFLKALGELVGEDILYQDDVQSASVSLTYSWSKE